MTQQEPNPVIRLMPSLTDIAFLMPLVLLFVRMGGTGRLLGDGDTGWHIRTGEWILAHGRVPQVDPFSFTREGHPWFAWEWLWDAGAALLHQHAGMAAVLIASQLVLCFTFALLFRAVLRECSNIALAFGVTFLAMAGSTLHWLARPHLMTLLFTVIFYRVLEAAWSGRMRMLLWLPVLMVVWTNLHGGFLVGILLAGCYTGGELIGWLLARDTAQARAALARGKYFLLATLATGAATLVNPYTYRLHIHVYRFLSESSLLRYINEYQSTQFQTALARWYEPMVLLGVAAAARSLYHKRFAHALLIAGWLHLGLFAVRNLPIYLLLAAPAVAGLLQESLAIVAKASLAPWVGRSIRAFENFTREFGETDRIPRWHLASGLVFAAVAAVFFAPAPPPSFQAVYDTKTYPSAALSVLKHPKMSRSIFTDDEWGDYLIYRLYPNTKVFVDGRFDLYGEDFTKKYLDLLNGKYGWEETLNQYGVDTVLLRVETPLTTVLKESGRWRPVYDDGMAIVFRAEAALARNARHQGSGTSSTSSDGESFGREATRVVPRGPRTTS